jgi:hypothetical protein
MLPIAQARTVVVVSHTAREQAELTYQLPPSDEPELKNMRRKPLKKIYHAKVIVDNIHELTVQIEKKGRVILYFCQQRRI